MAPSTTASRASRYEVVVPGSFGPGHRAALTDNGTLDAELTTVFLLCLPPDARIREVVEALEAHGMVILDIRRLEQRARPR